MGKSRNVLAVVTDSEKEKFIDLELTIAAVNEMQDNLLNQLKLALKKKQEFWNEIQEVYKIDGELQFNRLTGEITKP